MCQDVSYRSVWKPDDSVAKPDEPIAKRDQVATHTDHSVAKSDYSVAKSDRRVAKSDRSMQNGYQRTDRADSFDKTLDRPMTRPDWEVSTDDRCSNAGNEKSRNGFRAAFPKE